MYGEGQQLDLATFCSFASFSGPGNYYPIIVPVLPPLSPSHSSPVGVWMHASVCVHVVYVCVCVCVCVRVCVRVCVSVRV